MKPKQGLRRRPLVEHTGAIKIKKKFNFIDQTKFIKPLPNGRTNQDMKTTPGTKNRQENKLSINSYSNYLKRLLQHQRRRSLDYKSQKKHFFVLLKKQELYKSEETYLEVPNQWQNRRE